MKNLKLIFDADGVVCTGGMFTPHLEREHGIAPKSLAAFFANTFPHCITGHRNLLAEIAPVLPTIGWRASPEAFLEFWFTREHVVDERLLACIAELRSSGMACYLGTNQEKHRVAYMREQMGFAQRFDRVFASCELGAAKPDPQFFYAIATTLAYRAQELVLIDDSARNVAAAKACGWHAVHYRTVSDLESFLRECAADAAL